MSQQTRIDQFYKSIRSDHLSDSIKDKIHSKSKKTQESKSHNSTRNRRVSMLCQKRPLNYNSSGPDGSRKRQSVDTNNVECSTLSNKSSVPFQISNIAICALENINMVQGGAISLHNFNLEEIYSNNMFEYQFNITNPNTSLQHDLKNIKKCNDLQAKVLLKTIFDALSKPINCGYFDKDEVDFIYSIITLPEEPLMLLARLLKRKRMWFRKTDVKYPEISDELKSTFYLLVFRSICTFNIEDVPISTILELLHVEEIRQICQCMKVNSKGSKENNINKLINLSNIKPLFPGMPEPRTFLYDLILNVLDYCVCLTPRTWHIIDRIITLLVPNEDPLSSTSDTFFMLKSVYFGDIALPNSSECVFPLFSSKLHLNSYIEAKSHLSATLRLIEKKKWNEVKSYGNKAMDTLSDLLNAESVRLRNSTLPMHVRRYMPGYTWLKVLSKSVQAFKRDKNKNRAVEVLQFLVQQDCHMNAYKGQWYEEIALIQMSYLSMQVESVQTVQHALSLENLTQVDKQALLTRATKIFKKLPVSLPIRLEMNYLLRDYDHELLRHEPPTTTIYAKLRPGNVAGVKSIWSIDSNTSAETLGRVEVLAHFYYLKQGFSRGIHCEGALPIVLFTTLFWEELYETNIPGVFATEYEYVPSDLFTEEFYKNRKEKIDCKLRTVQTLNSEVLGALMEKKFDNCRQYKSIMPQRLLEDLELKEVVCCLGVEGVVGICKKMIENFKLWSAGFPDLFMWNYNTKTHKIIEVKGPGDTLSIKQRLWMEYLHQIGLTTELCFVKGKYSIFMKIRHKIKVPVLLAQ